MNLCFILMKRRKQSRSRELLKYHPKSIYLQGSKYNSVFQNTKVSYFDFYGSFLIMSHVLS